MSRRSTKRENGFSLLEMTIAMALGTIVLGAAVQLYSQGVAATWTVSQRAEMQQDFRAASNMMTRDLSMAGAGMGQGAAIQLPTSATIPQYGCDQTPKCYLGTVNTTAATYPEQGTTPYLYGLVPGYNGGPTINSLVNDVVTVAYTDSTFYLDCYTATIASTTTVTFALPGSTSSNCTSPTGNTGAQAVNDAVVGLTPGDLVLFNFGSTQLVAEVNGSVSATTVTFGTGDPLKMNQPAAATQSLAYQFTHGAVTGFATRILAITYYTDNTVSPPRLMRQVNGHAPMPVAENIVYMKFNYDLYNTTTNSAAVGCSNPGAATDGCAGASTGLLPNQITKINVQHMAMDSTLHGAKGYQGLDLETSVSARNLTYANKYPQ
jgi:prepilin-type N-terminal cleavage/methylation domain-containing protein